VGRGVYPASLLRSVRIGRERSGRAMDVFRELYEKSSREATDLWQAIGELKAHANPEGRIAKDFGHTADQRLAEIWKILQSLKP
jgi:hypothetical protein